MGKDEAALLSYTNTQKLTQNGVDLNIRPELYNS